MTMTLFLSSKPHEARSASNLNDFDFALPSSLDSSLPIRATARESHCDPTAPRMIYSPTFIQIGRPLVHAESSHELCMALVDALLGWLSLHQSGFVHRDISIVNVLLTGDKLIVKALPNIPFGPNISKIAARIGVPANIPVCSPAVNYFSAHTSDAAPPRELADFPISPMRLAAEITALLSNISVGRTYAGAFVADGDIAVDWRTKLDSEDACTPTAPRRPFFNPMLRTPQFMSLDLHKAMISNSSTYMQSPVDDIESFFWLTLWAVLFNSSHCQNRTQMEREWQQGVDRAEYLLKLSVSTDLKKMDSYDFALNHGAILGQLLPLLQKWWKSQETLADKWRATANRLKRERLHTNDYPHDAYYFHLFALFGVRDFLDLVKEEHDTLKTYADFPHPSK